jgi:predicted nuclease of predicted toxin-antitoxin system
VPRTIRFHLDEHADPAIADGLRRRGADVTTTSEADLRGATDAQQLAYAIANGRMLVTQDQDFLQIHVSCVTHSEPRIGSSPGTCGGKLPQRTYS